MRSNFRRYAMATPASLHGMSRQLLFGDLSCIGFRRETQLRVCMRCGVRVHTNPTASHNTTTTKTRKTTAHQEQQDNSTTLRHPRGTAGFLAHARHGANRDVDSIVTRVGDRSCTVIQERDVAIMSSSPSTASSRIGSCATPACAPSASPRFCAFS